MYGTIRRYKLSKPKEFNDAVNASFINVVRKVPGFISYIAIDEGEVETASPGLPAAAEQEAPGAGEGPLGAQRTEPQPEQTAEVAAVAAVHEPSSATPGEASVPEAVKRTFSAQGVSSRTSSAHRTSNSWLEP